MDDSQREVERKVNTGLIDADERSINHSLMKDKTPFQQRFELMLSHLGLPDRAALGRILNVTNQVLYNWYVRDQRIGSPSRRDFESVTGVSVDWVNDGIEPMLLRRGSLQSEDTPSTESRPVRIDADTIQDAYGYLDELDQILGREPEARPHPARLAIALEVVSAGEVVDGKSTVIRLSDKLREWGELHGNEQGKAAGTGSTDGGPHELAASGKTKVAAGRKP